MSLDQNIIYIIHDKFLKTQQREGHSDILEERNILTKAFCTFLKVPIKKKTQKAKLHCRLKDLISLTGYFNHILRT